MVQTIILYVLWGIPIGISAVCLIKLIDLKGKVNELDVENSALWAALIDVALNNGGAIKKLADEAKKKSKKTARKPGNKKSGAKKITAKKTTNKKGDK